MNKQEKIDVIYEKIANKELDFGCIITEYDEEDIDVREYVITQYYGCDKFYMKYTPNTMDEEFSKEFSVTDLCFSDDSFNYQKYNCKGHPVMIGDVFQYFNDIFDYEEIHELLNLWKNKRLPIEKQSEECINYVYNLIIN